jgi:LEA14-like dessication related protein
MIRINHLHSNLLLPLLVMIFSFLLNGCSSAQLAQQTKLEEPTIDFTKYQILSVTQKRVELDILFNAHNPNDLAIDSFFMDYELFVDGRSFVKGLKVKLNLIPKGKSTITVPVTIYYKDLLRSISSVATLIVKSERNLPMAADVNIYGQYKVLGFLDQDFKYLKKVDLSVPLPKYSVNDVMQFIQGIR